ADQQGELVVGYAAEVPFDHFTGVRPGRVGVGIVACPHQLRYADAVARLDGDGVLLEREVRVRSDVVARTTANGDIGAEPVPMALEELIQAVCVVGDPARVVLGG